jgi:hypothetical protein
MERKILYNAFGYGVIYFPKGEQHEGGSCQFATEECLLSCEEENNDFVKDVYDFVITKPVSEVLAQIVNELKENNMTLLYWFESGDCESKHEDRVIKIIEGVASLGFVQSGFTRNVNFWKRTRNIPRTRLVLTVENMGQIDEFESGVFGIPMYGERNTRFVVKTSKTEPLQYGMCGYCNDTWMELQSSEMIEVANCEERFVYRTDGVFEASCALCLKHQRGCFNGFCNHSHFESMGTEKGISHENQL